MNSISDFKFFCVSVYLSICLSVDPKKKYIFSISSTSVRMDFPSCPELHSSVVRQTAPYVLRQELQHVEDWIELLEAGVGTYIRKTMPVYPLLPPVWPRSVTGSCIRTIFHYGSHIMYRYDVLRLLRIMYEYITWYSD